MKLWPAINKPGDTIDVLGIKHVVAHVGRRHNSWGMPIIECLDGFTMTDPSTITAEAFNERTAELRAEQVRS